MGTGLPARQRTSLLRSRLQVRILLRALYEWKVACGHDPAGARDHVPPRASPEKIRQLADLLDREEAELEALEPGTPPRSVWRNG